MIEVVGRIPGEALQLGERLRLPSENTRNMILGANHGMWNLAIIPSSGIIQFAIAGRFHRFNPGVDLLNDSWYRIAASFTETTMRFFVDDVTVADITLPEEDMARIFTQSRYGLGIGGSGPWYNTATTAKFVIDNLHVSSMAKV